MQPVPPELVVNENGYIDYKVDFVASLSDQDCANSWNDEFEVQDIGEDYEDYGFEED